MRRSPGAIVINVANPLDVLTYHILQLTGLPPPRVIGTGTLIDSARFRELLGAQIGVHPVDLGVYIMGEHGDTQFAALSAATCGGELIDATPDRLAMIDQAKQSAWEVFNTKGYTNYAVAMAVQLIVQSIAEDLRFTMPVSVLIDGYCEQHDVCLSVPCVVGRAGVTMQLRPRLSDDEAEKFRRSAATVRGVIDRTRGIVIGARKNRH
jgi:L-lactate dehydrogenase